MILCLGLTPAAQRVMVFRTLALDKVNRAARTVDGIAGKAINVAKVLHVLQEQPLAAGFLGGARGEQMRAALFERGIRSEFVTVTAPTRQCVTVIDESAGTVTELVEESQPVDPAAYGTLFGIVEKHVSNCRAVVMSGTITSGGPAEFYRACAEVAHRAGALTVVDASGAALREVLKAAPGLVKPNRAELEATVGRQLIGEDAVMQAMLQLHQLGAQRVVITSGASPVLALEGGKFWRVTSPKVAALNPIGSGDAFTAGLTARLLQGGHLGDACRLGAAAGAANAMTLMAGEVEKQEVERLVGEVRLEEV